MTHPSSSRPPLFRRWKRDRSCRAERRGQRLPTPPVSNGEFVGGPNVGDFDIQAFLQNRDSPLAPYAQDVALWASYSSVNPRLLLAVLEFRYGLVTSLPDGAAQDEGVGMTGGTD